MFGSEQTAFCFSSILRQLQANYKAKTHRNWLMDIKSLAPLQVTLPPVGETASASVSLADYRKNEKLAAAEQRVRELQTLLLCASRERLRLMNQIAEVREKLLCMEGAKAIFEGYELHEVAPGWFAYKSGKRADNVSVSYACPEWHHTEKVTTLQVIDIGRQQTIYRCSSPSCRFLKTVDAW